MTYIKQDRYLKECARCKSQFEGLNHQIYCSKQCASIVNGKRSYMRGINNRSKNIPLESKGCKMCKIIFLPKNKSQLFCCKECGTNFYKKQYNENQCNGTSGEFLKLRFETFKRDNFSCQYCGRSVKEDKIKLHLEHIIPKAKGGTNNPDNLTTSCSDCNLGKFDVLLEEKQLNSKNGVF